MPVLHEHPPGIFITDTDNNSSHNTQSLIGIAVAVGGNVLISLALNCQKLAHKRLELQKQQKNSPESRTPPQAALDSDNISLGESHPLIGGGDGHDSYTTPSKLPSQSRSRSRPRLQIPQGSSSPWRSSGLASSPVTVEAEEGVRAVAIEILDERDRTDAAGKRGSVETIQEEAEKTSAEGNESDYLKSKLWWFGFLLMNVGEFGNFLSYAYAPASVVAPLGTVALIANCIFAPLMLKEKLRKRDIIGIFLAILGAVTVVGAGKSSDARLDHDELIRAITQRPFEIYAIVCAVLILVLGILSAGPAGKTWVFVDVALCALFGGFTVLATKAVSTLLSLHWIDIFKDWITYPVVVVLAITGIGQIKYLNRALMKFDSKVVIPTFFVSFNLSAIVGSAILYGDFRDVNVHRFTTFLYGCVTTFLGVFFLTRSTAQSGAALEKEVVHPEGADDDDGDGNPVQRGQLGRVRPALHPLQSPRATPILRNQKSSTSLVLSPGQYLLLAASPPRDHSATPLRNNDSGVESPGSISRRRTNIVWDSST